MRFLVNMCALKILFCLPVLHMQLVNVPSGSPASFFKTICFIVKRSESRYVKCHPLSIVKTDSVVNRAGCL